MAATAQRRCSGGKPSCGLAPAGGIGFAKSGNLYVTLSGSNAIAEVGPDGKEIGRFPDPVTNNNYMPPLDSPLDVAFRGNSLLVANSAYLSNTAANFAILDVNVGEPGYDVMRPKVPGGASATQPKLLKLTVKPRKVRAGKRVRVHFRVASGGKGVGGAAIRIFVRGGFADVSSEGLTILAEVAIPLDEMDAAAIAAEVRNAEEDVADAKDPGRRADAELRLNQLKEVQAAL